MREASSPYNNDVTPLPSGHSVNQTTNNNYQLIKLASVNQSDNNQSINQSVNHVAKGNDICVKTKSVSVNYLIQC